MKLGFWNRLAIVAGALSTFGGATWFWASQSEISMNAIETSYDICIKWAGESLKRDGNYKRYDAEFAQCSDERNRGWDHMPGWTEWWWSALGAFALTLIAYTIIAAVVWTAKWVWRGRPKKNIP